MKVSYLVRDDGACGYYRMILPHEVMGMNGNTVKHIEKGDTADHIEECLDCDVFVAARPNEASMIDFLKRIKEAGTKLVVDFDDDLFSVSPMSSHYKEWGTENIQIEVEGKKITLWEDGKNIDLMANRMRLEAIKRSCEVADAISVTQPILADVYSEFGKTICLPNCVDTDIWKKLPLKREDRDEVRLYWSGGASHYEDWAMMSDALKIVMNKYPQAKLVLMGTKFAGTLKGIPSKQIEYHDWVPTLAYPYKSAILDADISLIPLRDTHFNRCKSSIKMVEQGALGVPSVFSGIPPYSDFYNGENGVFVENNSTQGWVEGISHLIENPIDRWGIGGEAKTSVKNNYDIKKEYVQWEKAYQEILDGD